MDWISHGWPCLTPLTTLCTCFLVAAIRYAEKPPFITCSLTEAMYVFTVNSSKLEYSLNKKLPRKYKVSYLFIILIFMNVILI